MLIVETIAKICRAFFVHGQAIKAICRELGVSRKVVRKVIRSEMTSSGTSERLSPFRRLGRGVTSRPVAGVEREQGVTGTADVDPVVRRTSRPGLRGRI